jgi:hypothetical protein
MENLVSTAGHSLLNKFHFEPDVLLFPLVLAPTIIISLFIYYLAQRRKAKIKK